jgi:hypothetical protein
MRMVHAKNVLPLCQALCLGARTACAQGCAQGAQEDA